MKQTKNTYYVDNPFQSPAVLSLCPGFLGLERGLQRAIGKIRVVAYVEIEAFIVANLIAGMQAGMVDAAPVWTDVKTFNAKPFYKKIHGIMGGYPCQPFSTAGKRKGQDDPRHLWPSIYRIIQAARPVWCFFENVSGHISMGFDQVYKELRHLGYSVEAGIFTAEEAGAPHERERLFILAIDDQFLANSHIEHDDWIRKFWPGRRFESSNRREPNGQMADNNGSNAAKNSEGYNEGKDGNKAWPDEFIKSPGSSDSGEQPNLDNSGGIGYKQEYSIPAGRNSIEYASKDELAHTDSAGQPQQWHNGEQGCQNNNGAGHTGAEVSDTNTEQLQIGECQRGNNGQEQQAIAGVYSEWPAGPGQPQHHWEEKRTVEPGLGSTIDGYNFREDLLRAYGNSVVEQTAEIAFINLLRKHIRNLSIINDQKPSFGG